MNGNIYFTAANKNDVNDHFAAFTNGLYTAKVGGALADAAVWKTGDPPFDFKGNDRPNINNASDYAGADRP